MERGSRRADGAPLVSTAAGAVSGAARFRVAPLDEDTLAGALAVKDRGWWDTYLPWLGREALERMDASAQRRHDEWLGHLRAGRLASWVALADGAGAGGAGADGAGADGAGAGGAGRASGRSGVSGAAPRVVGIAGGGPPRPDEALPDVEAQLYSLYVDAAWRGSGVADALIRAAIGTGSALLWVLEHNPRALAFYERQGFRADGAAEELGPEWNGARQIRMVRR